MRKALNICIGIINSFILFFSIIFIIIEGRLVLSSDWTVYDNVYNGLLRYLLRLFLAILVFIFSIIEFINLKLQKESLFFYLVYIDLGLIIMSLLTLIFGSNYVGVVCSIFIGLITLLKLYYYLLVYRSSNDI